MFLFAVFYQKLVADSTYVDLSNAWKATPTATISGTSTICVGQSANLSISFTEGPVDIVYTNGYSNFTITGLVTSPHLLSVTPPVGSNIYTLVSVNNSSCSGTVSGAGVVTVNALPTATIINVSPTQCYGYANGSATVNPVSGTMPFSYLWDNGITSAINNNLIAGTHTVIVTSANGCQNTYSTTIGQPAELVLGIASTTNVNCGGVNNGSATVYAVGGTTPYSYNWSNGMTGSTVTNLASGTYTVTVTDDAGCTDIIPVTIGVDPAPVATITSVTNVTCYGSHSGTATVTVTNGTAPYSYLWNNGQTTQTATGLAAGTYYCTIHDANGCMDVTSSVTITQPTQLVATLTVNNVNCTGMPLGSANVSVTGGTPPYHYVWSTGAVTSSVNNLAQGGYSLTVTDVNGCMSTGSPFYFTVGQDPVPVADAIITSGSSSCGGSPVDLLASGGTSYQWNTGHTTAAITVTPLVATWYYVTVSNGFGCSDVDSVYVPVNPAPVITFTLPSDVCSDAAPIALGSLASVVPYNGGQIWFTGAGVALNTFYPSTVGVGGTYAITASYTDPTTGCMDSNVQLITVHHPPTITLDIPVGSMCINDPQILLSGASHPGGTWSGPGVDPIAGTFNPAIAGVGAKVIVYTYTDIYGCTVLASDVINVYAPATVIMSIPATEMCTGDAPININVSPSGGYVTANGLNLEQTGLNTFEFDPEGLTAGTYEIIYTLPSALCGGSNTQYIEVYETPVVTLTTPTTLIAPNATPIMLTATPPGGQLTVDGNISGVYFDPAFWGLGIHNIVYTYSNSVCEASASVTITVGYVGIDDVDVSSLIGLYPNPMSNVLNISLGDVNVSEIQIYDVMGKIIRSKGVESDHVTVDVYDFAPGMYFVRLVMQDGHLSEPFKVVKN